MGYCVPRQKLALPDEPISIMYYNQYIVVGYQREYNLIVATTGSSDW